MARALLIAEKPSLMRDIQAVYNKYSFVDMIDFEAFAGHTMQLKSPGDYKDEWGKKEWSWDMLPIIPDKFQYKVSSSKTNLYKRIRDKIKTGNYDYLINACDPDREGEHIFRSFIEVVGCNLPCKRFWTNDLTEDSIKKQLENLRSSNENFFVNLGKSSQLRARFDWLIGMNLTVASSLQMKNTVKVGRVKSPTLKILVDRELEIRNFVPKTYWELEGIFEGYSGTYFTEEDGVIKFNHKNDAEKVIKSLKEDSIIEKVEKKTESQSAPQLYTLNSLQSDANKIYGFSADKARNIMQSLYEKKILTYPRTDNPCISTQIAKEFAKRLKPIAVIKDLATYVTNAISDTKTHSSLAKNTKYVNDKKMAESGHFAIIPTGLTPNLSLLTSDEQKILDMVYRRFLAIFLPPMKFSKTTIITNSNNNLFRTSGKILLDKGFSVLYKTNTTDKLLPDVKKGQTIKLKGTNLNEKTTTPPPRYTEGTLLDVLENPVKFLNNTSLKDIIKEHKGIGTTATRADIIIQLIEDKYIKKEKNKGKIEYLYATDKGISIIQNLEDKDIISVDMTGIWEEKLGYVENGSMDFNAFSKEMIAYVLKSIKDIQTSSMTKVDNNTELAGICPKCKKPVKGGTNYYFCSDYKKGCDFIVNKTIFETKIPANEMAKALSGTPTKEFTFKKKDKTTGKTESFKARLVYSQDKNQLMFTKGAVKEIGVCPYCKSPIKETESYYLCSKYKDTCNLCIPKVKNGAKITVSDVKKLIKGDTLEKEFTWKSGKSSKAKFKLENGYIKFLF